MSIRSQEVIRHQLQLALRAAREGSGQAATWAFAAYSDAHPEGERHGAVWWVQTVGGERLPLTVALLQDLQEVEAGCWIWGHVIATLDTGPLQGDTPIVTDLVIQSLITPRGVAFTPSDHSEIRARMSAHDALWCNPLVCVVRGPRPRSWPL